MFVQQGLRLCSHNSGWLLRPHENHTGLSFCSHLCIQSGDFGNGEKLCRTDRESGLSHSSSQSSNHPNHSIQPSIQPSIHPITHPYINQPINPPIHHLTQISTINHPPNNFTNHPFIIHRASHHQTIHPTMSPTIPPFNIQPHFINHPSSYLIMSPIIHPST